MKRFLLALVAAVSVAAADEPAAKFGALTVGAMVPDFSATGADGKDVKLAGFKGRVLVLNFWATNRGPADQLETVFGKYAAQGVAVLGVCSAATREEFDAWRAKHAGAASYSLAWDPAGKVRAESLSQKKFGLGVYPATAVLDRDGKLVGGFIGSSATTAGILRGYLHDAGVTIPADELPKPAVSPDEDGNLLKPGTPAPDFTALDAAGQPLKISDFAGKFVVLDFWATWCGPCLASMPHTERVAAATKDQDVIVLASCTSDTRAKFEEWVKQNAATYPDLVFAHDAAERGAERASKKLYGVNGIPTQFLIGRDGKVISSFVGYGEGDTRLEQELAKHGVYTVHASSPSVDAAAGAPAK